MTHRIFLKSSSALRDAGADEAAASIANLVDYMAGYVYDDHGVSTIEDAVATIRTGLESANRSLEKLMKISKEEAADFESLLIKRLNQLRELDPA